MGYLDQKVKAWAKAFQFTETGKFSPKFGEMARRENGEKECFQAVLLNRQSLRILMTSSHYWAELFSVFISATCFQCPLLLFSRAYVRYSLTGVWDCDEHITLPTLCLVLSVEFSLMLSFIGNRQWSFGVLSSRGCLLAFLTIAVIHSSAFTPPILS